MKGEILGLPQAANFWIFRLRQGGGEEKRGFLTEATLDAGSGSRRSEPMLDTRLFLCGCFPISANLQNPRIFKIPNDKSPPPLSNFQLPPLESTYVGNLKNLATALNREDALFGDIALALHLFDL